MSLVYANVAGIPALHFWRFHRPTGDDERSRFKHFLSKKASASQYSRCWRKTMRGSSLRGISPRDLWLNGVEIRIRDFLLGQIPVFRYPAVHFWQFMSSFNHGCIFMGHDDHHLSVIALARGIAPDSCDSSALRSPGAGAFCGLFSRETSAMIDKKSRIIRRALVTARQDLAPAVFSHQRRLSARSLHRGSRGRSVQSGSLAETSEPVGHLRSLEIRL